jgi:hypothetical protein
LDPKENTAVNELAFPGVIENTFLSELVVINSLFEKNDFSDTKNPAVRIFWPLRHLEHNFHSKSNHALVVLYTAFWLRDS